MGIKAKEMRAAIRAALRSDKDRQWGRHHWREFVQWLNDGDRDMPSWMESKIWPKEESDDD